MRIALMGSVSSSEATLRALIAGGVEVVCVLGLDPAAAKNVGGYRDLRPLAEAARIPYQAFRKVSEPAVRELLFAHRPDQLWVIGLSQLVPSDLLALAPRGGVGFHPTLLPEGRGRAPVAWTILRNARAAVSLFFLTEEPDAGDLIAQREVEVLPDDYSHTLIERLDRALEQVVLELAPAIVGGALPRAPQDHALATFYPRRKPEDGEIDWRDSETWVHRLVRAAGRPYPGAFTFAPGGARLTIWRAVPLSASDPLRRGLARPGEVIAVRDGLPVVALGSHGEGRLCLTEVEWCGAGGGGLEAGLVFESSGGSP